MKNCKILIGPIAGTDRNYDEGEVMELEDKDADLFGSWGFVEILPVSKADPKLKTAPQLPEEGK